jgi:hypothetical protein
VVRPPVQVDVDAVSIRSSNAVVITTFVTAVAFVGAFFRTISWKIVRSAIPSNVRVGRIEKGDDTVHRLTQRFLYFIRSVVVWGKKRRE